MSTKRGQERQRAAGSWAASEQGLVRRGRRRGSRRRWRKRRGRGVAKNEALAARWFREAAGADSPLAQLRLSRLLADGRGVEKDPAEAARWYLIASERGLQDPYMDDWLTRLDAPTRKAAADAAALWRRVRGGRMQAVASVDDPSGPGQADPGERGAGPAPADPARAAAPGMPGPSSGPPPAEPPAAPADTPAPVDKTAQ